MHRPRKWLSRQNLLHSGEDITLMPSNHIKAGSGSVGSRNGGEVPLVLSE